VPLSWGFNVDDSGISNFVASACALLAERSAGSVAPSWSVVLSCYVKSYWTKPTTLPFDVCIVILGAFLHLHLLLQKVKCLFNHYDYHHHQQQQQHHQQQQQQQKQGISLSRLVLS